ncbi:hypothetical protein BHK69_17585 [Bosea vaviloviae]|uniref:Uncharacterized protein n=1 Tax=Bosea vaviloviae TaxID=1526658 RepID=A0A1D7U3R6_9HYPH|nr:hypothetical protein BHK69_17585 [Bosea vaviloviae]
MFSCFQIILWEPILNKMPFIAMLSVIVFTSLTTSNVHAQALPIYIIMIHFAENFPAETSKKT